jgi:peptidoglycan/LPS O-acetylase OafA/YrhL
MFLGFFLVPVSGSLEIRGWGEMFPLNGPAWTLLFEYIANLLYALVFRHLPNVILIILVILSGAALIHLGVAGPRGDVIGGWSLTGSEIRIGFIRLLYPFLAGLLLSRIINPGKVRWAFLWCSLLIIVVLSIPRLGGAEQKWINGLYDALTIILVFPLIVYLGASGEVKGKLATRLSRFLGQISYPIYITHYPLIYIYASWVVDNEVSATWALTGGFILVLASIAIAYVTLKWYDIPVRKWLARRFLFKK